MKPRTIAVLLVSIVAASTAAGMAAPSDGCGTGQVPPHINPMGIGLSVVGDPQTGPVTLTACNTGVVIPSPAKGAVKVRIDPQGQTGYAEVDGDADNTAVSCADGFARVAVGSGGPTFYESPNGSFTDTNPSKKGKQPAQAEGPDAFVQNIAANCAPA